MAPTRAVVRLTANFEANLADIAAYWDQHEAPQAFERLLDELDDTVIGNLERHPRIGRRFFARSPLAVETHQRVNAITQRFGAAEVREYLSGDYLILYLVAGSGRRGDPTESVYLLAIRHRLQLSFDFDGFWRANRAGED